MLAAIALGSVPFMAQAEEKKSEKSSLSHVVLFKFKKDAPAGTTDAVIADCHKLLAKIPAVRSVKAGKPTKEKAEKFVKDDYDVALIITVDDYEGLLAYHKHPLHKEFVEKHGKHIDLDALRVFDFTDGK
jgi:hypothetical protein